MRGTELLLSLLACVCGHTDACPYVWHCQTMEQTEVRK